jgi:hypothetical protein
LCLSDSLSDNLSDNLSDDLSDGLSDHLSEGLVGLRLSALVWVCWYVFLGSSWKPLSGPFLILLHRWQKSSGLVSA